MAVLRRGYNPDDSLLDLDADEVLLGLLARDNEPPPKHDMPHRRWMNPPQHEYRTEDGFFCQVAPGWWRIETWVEIEADQARRVAEWKARIFVLAGSLEF